MGEDVRIEVEDELHAEDTENHRMDRVPLLHIYPHAHPRSKIEIIGTKNALRALKDALDAAIKSKDSMACAPNFYDKDGEGYGVMILCNDEPWDSRVWAETCLPYPGDDAPFDGKSTKDMKDIVGSDKYYFYMNLIDQLHQGEIQLMNQILDEGSTPMPTEDAMRILQTLTKKLSPKLGLASEKEVNSLVERLKALMNTDDK